MTIDFKTKVEFGAAATSGTRVDSGYEAAALAATRQLLHSDKQFLELTSDDSGYKVVLPEANTGNIAVGYRQRIKVGDASAEDIVIQTYDAVTPVDLQTIRAGFTYEFVCTSVSTAAGSWQINIVLEDDQLEAERYVATFNATTDWTDGGTAYAYTVAAATHSLGVVGVETDLEEGTGPYTKVEAQISVAANNDVTVTVEKAPDLRFAGRLILM